jgi:glucose/arabinose dehydrogenase
MWDRTLSKAPLRTVFRIAMGACLLGLALSSRAFAVPADVLHPGWTLVNLRPNDTFKPMVTGMGFLSDGSLVLSHWGGSHDKLQLRQMNGAVYVVKNVTGDNPSPVVSTFADKLEDPVGMLVKDDRIYVTGGERLIELPDADKNGKAEAARAIVTIPGTHVRHEFLFGGMFKDGRIWMNASSAKDIGGGLPGWGQANPNRGTMMSVDPNTGAHEVYAMGLREPNGMGMGPEGEIFVPDVQGNWLPSCKLINVRKGRFYGFRHQPRESWDNMKESPPAVYLPQGEVSQAPGNPLYIESGKYAGQMFIGDAAMGGIRRIFLEKVAGEWQGTSFFFSFGFEGGPNRLIWGPDGYLYVGICGEGAGWSFKQNFGLQKMKPNGKNVFEMLSVRSRKGGMEIQYTDEINAAAADKANYTVKSWSYAPDSNYGGPKIDNKTLAVAATQVSPDRKSVYLDIPGLVAGKVVHISLASGIASKAGDALWTKETWYSLNAMSPSGPFEGSLDLGDIQARHNNGLAKGIHVKVAQGRLMARLAGHGYAALEVRDIRGGLVARAQGRDRLESGIPMDGWAPGAYSVRIRDGELSAERRVTIP